MTETTKRKKRSKAYAGLVFLGILTSRVFGLIRDATFAAFFGTSTAADAFKAALRIPNFMQNLLGEGVLSASFIPVYAKLLAQKDDETAGRVAGMVFTLLGLLVAALVLIGVLAAPALVDLITDFDGERRDLTIELTRIIFPGVGFLVLSAWCLGILNSHKRFFLSYVAPAVLNVVMIATLLWFGFRGSEGASLAVILAWATLLGMILQFGVQIPSVLRYSGEIRYGLDLGFEPVREVIRNFLPVVVGRGAVQVSSFVDLFIASILVEGAFSTLTYAQLIYMLPISLFGMSVAASELPQMSGALGEDSEVAEKLRSRLHAGLRNIAFLVAPSAMAFVFIGDQLASAIFERGQINSADIRLIWFVLIAISMGLLAVTFSRLLSSTYYALKDTKTPLKYSLVRISVSALLGYLLAVPLRPMLVQLLEAIGVALPAVKQPESAIGILGVAIGSTVGGWVEYFLLKRQLKSRIGDFSEELSFLAKLWTAAVSAGLVSWFAGRPAARFAESLVTSRFGLDQILGGLVAALVFGITYLVITGVMRIPELNAILRRIPLASNFLAKG